VAIEAEAEEEVATEAAAEAATEAVAEVAHQETEYDPSCLRWQPHHFHDRHSLYLLCSSA